MQILNYKVAWQAKLGIHTCNKTQKYFALHAFIKQENTLVYASRWNTKYTITAHWTVIHTSTFTSLLEVD